jgi:hypothetical protein
MPANGRWEHILMLPFKYILTGSLKLQEISGAVQASTGIALLFNSMYYF